MKTVAVVTLIALVLCCAVPLASASLCEFTEGGFYLRKDVLSCFYSVPFSESVRIQTLDTLNKTKELYAFVDIVHDSPDQENLPLSVDIQAELARIGRKQYTNDFDFHDDLRALYVRLGDAHTQYYAPICYRNFLIRQPIPPTYYVDDNNNDVIAVSRYMSQDLVDYFKATQNFDITTLIGAEIVSINGVKAYDYFYEYALNNVGMSKDPSTRFHVTMTQPQPQPQMDVAASSYWQTRTKRNPMPESDSVRYVFHTSAGQTLTRTFEWTFVPLKSYNDQADFMKDYWAVPATKPSQQLPLPSAKNEPREHVKDVLMKPKHLIEGTSSDDYTLLINTDDVYFWALNDGMTLVMYLDTMLPETYLKTYYTINKGFTLAAEMGLTRMIVRVYIYILFTLSSSFFFVWKKKIKCYFLQIDLTNDGGGDICFGRSLLAYLQGKDSGSVNWGPQDLPLSPLQANLTTSAVNNDVSTTVWSPGFYRDEDGNHVANDDIEVIMPGIPHVRGGLMRNYSSLLHINNCGFWGYEFSPKTDFKPDDILILTHGFCGSTCALFANHAALYDNVKTIVAGGLQSRPRQQYTSFPGLQVVDDPELFNEFDALGGDTSPALPSPDDVVPRRLPTQAGFRYCIREIYPPQIVTDSDTQPMEFNFQAATHKIVDTLDTAENPYKLWYQVLKYF